MAETHKFQTIKVEVDGPLGRLTLNRPRQLNAIDATMLHELVEAARWFDSRSELRVVILSGAGRAFTAGADLKGSSLASGAPRPKQSWLDRREVGQYGLRATDALEQMRAITIAQLHGYVVGGGVVLTGVCDLRVAAEDASFFIPEIEMGIPLTWGAIPRLVREIGAPMTKELVITCRRFSSQEAKAIGFINRVVPAAHLAAEVEQIARDIIAKPSVPVSITKEHVNAVARVMGAGLTAFADGDALLATLADQESIAAALAYREKAFGKRRT